MHKFKNIFVLTLIIFSAVFFGACGDTAPTGPKYVSSLQLNVEEVEINELETFELTTEILPADAANKAISYFSMSPEIAAVDNITGVITPVSPGSAIIAVMSLDGSNKFDYVSVTINAIPENLGVTESVYISSGFLRWDSVENATSYNVKANGNIVATVNLPLYAIDTFNVSQNYSIQAIGDQVKYFDGEYSEVFSASVLGRPENFVNNQNIISWDAVTGAEEYQLLINDATITTTETTYELDVVVGVKYSVQVKAINNDPAVYDGRYTTILKTEKLEVPNDLYFDSTGFVWSSVEEAEGYRFELTYDEVTTEYDLDATIYEVAADLAPGEYRFRVKALGNGTTLLDSEYYVEKVIDKLTVPVNLVAEEGVITWDAVTGASDYTLKINSSYVQVETNSYSLGAAYLPGFYNISVVANGDNINYINSDTTEMVTVTKLAPATSRSVTGGEIVWAEVNNATGYYVNFINDTFDNTYTVFTNKYVSGTEIPAGTYDITITAFGDGYISSEKTESLQVQKLGTPTGLTVQNGNLVWSSIAKSSSYELVIGTDTIDAGVLNTYQLDDTFESLVDFNIKARAMGDNTRYLTSDYSGVITASKLEDLTGFTLVNGLIDINPVTNATDYVLEVNGIKRVLSESQFPYFLASQENTEYDLRVRARGADAYLSGDFTDVITATQLPDITDASVINNEISWSDLQEVISYEIWVKEQVEPVYLEEDVRNIGSLTSYDLDAEFEPGAYTIKIRGIGTSGNNISNYLSTNFTQEFNFEKFTTPISFSVFNGLVIWGNVGNADSYVLNVDGTDVNVGNVTSYALDQSFGVGSHTVKVKAAGDGVNYIDSDFTSEVAANKIDVVTGVTVTNGQLVWDENASATGGYAVKVDGGYYYTLVNSLDTENGFSAGTYDITVHALETNGYFSDPSNVVTIEKLSTPRDLRVEEGVVKWSPVLVGTGYRLFINNDPIDLDDQTLSYDLSTYPSYGPGAFDIKIKALGDNYGDTFATKGVIDSNSSGSVITRVMDEPGNLRVLGGLINWQAEPGAIDYELLIYEETTPDNYVVMTIDDPLLTGDVTEHLLGSNYPAGNYQIKIRAIGDGSDYITSEFTAVENIITVTKLPAPTTLRVEEGEIAYDAVANSTGYYVYANDTEVNNLTALTHELGIAFEAGEYDIEARAIGDNTIYLTSNKTNVVTATKRAAVEDFRVENGKLTWTSVDNPSGYILDINGLEVYEAGFEYELDNSYPGDTIYYIKIKAKGTNANYLNSDYTLTHQYTKPASITGLTVNNGVITWDLTTAENGYTVKVDGADDLIIDDSNTTFELNSSYVAGSYTVSIMINGDSTDTLNSIAEEITVTKLNSPAKPTLTNNSGEYVLNWDAIANATKYYLVIEDKLNPGQVYLDFTTTELSQSLWDSESQVSLLGTGAYEAYVYAIGDNNETGYVNSDASERLDLTQPSTPTNLAVNNGVVTWDASTNTTGYYLALTYNNGVDPEYDIIENVVGDTKFYLKKLGEYTAIKIQAYYEDSLTSEIPESVSTVFDLFESGEGIEGNPFEIVNETQLSNMRYNPTGHYIISNNITCVSADFIPVGTESEPFVGRFSADDGAGGYYTITNLNISGNYTYAGLFGYVGNGGVIEKLSLANAYVNSSSYYTGTIAGYNEGTIQNVIVTGSVLPNLTDINAPLYAGGISGYNTGTINNAISDTTVQPINALYTTYAGGITGYNNGNIYESGADVNGDIYANYAGGIAGYNNGDISESYNKGDVTATSVVMASISTSGYAGGIAGYNKDDDEYFDGNITNCYNLGTITATTDNALPPFAGGIVGKNIDESITYCYNAGSVTATSSYGPETYAGALIGENVGVLGNVENCYYLDTSSFVGINGVQGVNTQSKTDAELKELNFVSLLLNAGNPTAPWVYVSGNYPILDFE